MKNKLSYVHAVAAALFLILFLIIKIPNTVTYPNIFKAYLASGVCLILALYFVVVFSVTKNNKKLLFNFLLFHGTIIIMVIFIILVIQVLPSKNNAGCGIADQKYHHAMKEDCLWTVQNAEYTYTIQTNSMGLRTDEISQDKYNILILGDSFVLGQGVAQNQTFSALLQEQLGEEVQVINGGVLSNSPVMMYPWLVDNVEQINPDYVIIAVDNNDYFQDKSYAQFSYIQNGIRYINGTQDQGTGRFQKSIFSKILNSKIFTLADSITRSILLTTFWKPGFGKAQAIGNFTYDPLAFTRFNTFPQEIIEQIPITLESLQNIHRLLEQRNIPHIVVFYPWGHQVGTNQWSQCRQFFTVEPTVYPTTVQQTLATNLRYNDIQAYDLSGAFIQHNNTVLYYACDGHWNIEGHKIMAQALLDILNAS